jgi:hypothetical protein
VSALVIGEALVDVVEVPGKPLRRIPGGSPFNVAIGLARLQIPTALLTCLGADSDGDLLLSALDEAGAGRPHTRSQSNGIRIRSPTLRGMRFWMSCTSGRSGPSSVQGASSWISSWNGSPRVCVPSIPTSDLPSSGHEPQRGSAWSPLRDTSTW